MYKIKFFPLNKFFKRRASYHLKAHEFRNLQPFEFFLIIDEIKFKVPKFKS